MTVVTTSSSSSQLRFLHAIYIYLLGYKEVPHKNVDCPAENKGPLSNFVVCSSYRFFLQKREKTAFFSAKIEIFLHFVVTCKLDTERERRNISVKHGSKIRKEPVAPLKAFFPQTMIHSSH